MLYPPFLFSSFKVTAVQDALARGKNAVNYLTPETQSNNKADSQNRPKQPSFRVDSEVFHWCNDLPGIIWPILANGAFKNRTTIDCADFSEV